MLTGKVGILTGGTSTLGRETLIKLAGYGAEIIFTYYQNEELAMQLASQIRKSVGKVHAVQLNLCDINSIHEMFKKIRKEFGKLDFLINNVGEGKCKPTENLTLEEWNQTVQINLTAPFICSQEAIGLFLEQNNGKIINISSVAALTGGSFGAHYGATKAGLIGLTKSMARDYGKFGITCNAVAPGPIESEMTSSLGESVLNGILSATPQRRLGMSYEVAETICQILNPNINYINGQTIVIDGGRYMV